MSSKPATFNYTLIRELREQQDLTRDDLFTRLRGMGFTKGSDTLGNWERGENPPDAEDLPILAKALNVSVGDFYDGR